MFDHESSYPETGRSVRTKNNKEEIDMDNPFSSPQCTWYAWKRMKEATGLEITFDSGSRNGGDWFTRANNVDKFAKQDPKKSLEKTIACYSGGDDGYGHVSFIESVDETAKTVKVTEYYYGATSLPMTREGSFDHFFKGSTKQNFTFQGYLRKP